jgi:DNA-binding MarR family transcriptional regulator
MDTDIKMLVESFHEFMKSFHQKSYHKLKDKQIYPGQPKLLSVIKDNEGIPQKELCKKICVKPATITGMLVKLEANNYIYRTMDEADKRVMRVYLTPEGHQLALDAQNFLDEFTRQLFSDFSDEEVKTMHYLIDKMINNLRK